MGQSGVVERVASVASGGNVHPVGIPLKLVQKFLLQQLVAILARTRTWKFQFPEIVLINNGKSPNSDEGQLTHLSMQHP